MLRSTGQPAPAAALFAHPEPNLHGDRPTGGDSTDLTTLEAAAFLGSPAATLKNWRARDKGPPYYRGLRREVLYRRADLIEFRESLRVTPGHAVAA